jgi:hypothetical protein
VLPEEFDDLNEIIPEKWLAAGKFYPFEVIVLPGELAYLF